MRASQRFSEIFHSGSTKSKVNTHPNYTQFFEVLQNNLRDFTDIYINEMKKYENDANSSFNKENGIHNYITGMINLFVAGSETTSNTINYTLWYFCNYPEVQKKVQQEIDSVIGRNRAPSMDDKPNLPYLEAVVHETQRIVGCFN